MSESELKRLILAKSLFLHGCNHASNEDEVSRMLAIHNFDNTAEIILKCIATKRQLKFKRKYPYFEELLEKIEDLPLRDQIRNLHNIRNIVQHQGDTPSSEMVARYNGYVEDFFKEVVKQEFRISFDELSLARLVENAELRGIVQRAEESFRNEDYKECIKLCDHALIEATFETADIFGKAGMLTGYFGAADELKNVISKDYAEKYKGKEFYTLAKDLSKAVLQIGQASTDMQFFDEYRSRFLKFRKIIKNLARIPIEELREKARFSLDFVIGLVLKWQGEGMISPSNKK